jgi:outer membrane lipoprotein LolB
MRIWLGFLLTVLLAGCASLPSMESRPKVPAAVVESRIAHLGKIEHWTIRGRLAVKNNNDGFSASLLWQQHKDDFDIRLFDPLGRRVAWLVGNPQQVTLTTSDGQNYQGVDPQLLLRQRLGWELPLDSLKYWIKGLPDPNKVAWREEFDDFGRALILDQAQWRVVMSQYAPNEPLAQPGRIELERKDFTAKLLVDSRD